MSLFAMAKPLSLGSDVPLGDDLARRAGLGPLLRHAFLTNAGLTVAVHHVAALLLKLIVKELARLVARHAVPRLLEGLETPLGQQRFA